MSINETLDDRASALSRKAYDHLNNNEFEKALWLYDECLQIFKSVEDSRRLAMTCEFLATIQWYTLALNLYESLDDRERAGQTRENIDNLEAAINNAKDPETS